jgi:hypothetical protein
MFEFRRLLANCGSRYNLNLVSTSRRALSEASHQFEISVYDYEDPVENQLEPSNGRQHAPKTTHRERQATADVSARSTSHSRDSNKFQLLTGCQMRSDATPAKSNMKEAAEVS